MRISDWSSDVCSSYLPDLTVTNELGASPRRLGIGRLEDQFGARQRGQIGSPVLAIGFFKLVEGMHAKHEGSAKRARGLKAMIDRREIGRASCRERVCQYV